MHANVWTPNYSRLTQGLINYFLCSLVLGRPFWTKGKHTKFNISENTDLTCEEIKPTRLDWTSTVQMGEGKYLTQLFIFLALEANFVLTYHVFDLKMQTPSTSSHRLKEKTAMLPTNPQRSFLLAASRAQTKYRPSHQSRGSEETASRDPQQLKSHLHTHVLTR